MLDGEEGAMIKQAMELLIKIVEAYGAERMIDISYGHILSWELDEGLFELTASLCKNETVKVLP